MAILYLLCYDWIYFLTSAQFSAQVYIVSTNNQDYEKVYKGTIKCKKNVVSLNECISTQEIGTSTSKQFFNFSNVNL